MSRQPRFSADLWVPHGEIAAHIGVLITRGDYAGIGAYCQANSVEVGNFTGAVIKSLRDAGYVVDNDGHVSAPVKNLADWGTVPGDTSNSNRSEWIDAGVVHSVKFTVPVGPVIDATPQVTCTVALRPFGSGAVFGQIVDDPRDFRMPASFGAGGTTLASIDWLPNQGKTKYFVFTLGPGQAGTDANVLVQLPTKA